MLVIFFITITSYNIFCIYVTAYLRYTRARLLEGGEGGVGSEKRSSRFSLFLSRFFVVLLLHGRFLFAGNVLRVLRLLI